MKIGELERTHQVWRQKVNLRTSFPAGPATYYWCTKCGDVVATIPTRRYAAVSAETSSSMWADA